MTSNQTTLTPKDAKTNLILKWIFSVISIILLIASFSHLKVVSIIAFSIITLLIFPPLNEFCRSKFPFLGKRILKLFILIFLGVVGIGNLPSVSIKNKASALATSGVKQNPSVIIAFSEYKAEKKQLESQLTEKERNLRKQILKELSSNPIYKELTLKKSIDQRYLILLQAIGEGIVNQTVQGTFLYSDAIGKYLDQIPDGERFVINVIRLEMYGGFNEEILDVFDNYKNEFGISGSKGTTAIDASEGKAKFKLERDFTLVQALAVIDNKNPEVLDAYYEEINSGNIVWNDDPNSQYVHFYLTDKYLFNSYLKRNHRESKYFIDFDIKTTARSLYEEYDANEVVADDKYKNRKIAVTGVINGIGIDILDKPYITLRTDDYGSIQCFFISKNVVKNLRKGSKVTVVGSCSGKTLGNVIILDTVWF